MFKVRTRIAVVTSASIRHAGRVLKIGSADNRQSRKAGKSLGRNGFTPWEWVDASHAWGVLFGPRAGDGATDDLPVPFELTPLGWAA